MQILTTKNFKKDKIEITVNKNCKLDIALKLVHKIDSKPKEINFKLHENSELKLICLLKNQLDTNININIKHLEKKSSSKLLALFMGQKNYFTVNSTHLASHTESFQKLKNLATENTEINLISKVLIQKNLTRVKTNQIIENLQLSTQAKVRAKPELDIHSKEVEAKHSFANKFISPKVEFYLSSRGLSSKQVQKLFVKAFVKEVLKELDPLCQRQDFIEPI